MEKDIEKLLDDIMSSPENIGSLFANNQGLCIGARGKATPQVAGMMVAMSEQACKLHPNLNPPTLNLETSDKSCLIHKYGGITAAIYKQK